ncbi:MAG TPA: LacI family DNA-binding transcriptional regulator [Tahibacter sp.]|uniref:LacI family DNA-binding transcriptional regulator n=1 Tax=Tahibacter sp. TaxID=2056211 RepID=UPI002C49AE95|nr:LacI family DNA-binding transcriptional regulator [Tahibacter sp.]HSX61820.1 LacI family DNA-binding transcriptional regulator [Tahibacter sp.]
MSARGSSVTIKDVARRAGVSVASVSRALNGHESVTPETRQRILGIARELRYMPHGAARSLITRRTQTIGAVLPDLYGEFFSELIRGMDLAARRGGLHLLVSSSHGSADETAHALRALQGRVDGLLVMSPHADAGLLADNLPALVPTMLMNTRVDGDYASLNVDNYAGAYAMVGHLVARGFRRIALVAGPAQNFDAEERRRGYEQALRDLLPDAVPFVVDGDFTEAAGDRAARAIRESAPDVDAIFAANDAMAVGCLFALNELGLRVPRDVALVGFDDIPMARYTTPPLTTVRVRIADLGERAMARLIARIEQPDHADAGAEVLACELVVRQSCASDGTG